jgi:hypothetical protein
MALKESYLSDPAWWCKGRYIFYNSQEMSELSASARRERLVSYPLIWWLFRAEKIC